MANWFPMALAGMPRAWLLRRRRQPAERALHGVQGERPRPRPAAAELRGLLGRAPRTLPRPSRYTNTPGRCGPPGRLAGTAYKSPRQAVHPPGQRRFHAAGGSPGSGGARDRPDLQLGGPPLQLGLLGGPPGRLAGTAYKSPRQAVHPPGQRRFHAAGGSPGSGGARDRPDLQLGGPPLQLGLLGCAPHAVHPHHLPGGRHQNSHRWRCGPQRALGVLSVQRGQCGQRPTSIERVLYVERLIAGSTTAARKCLLITRKIIIPPPDSRDPPYGPLYLAKKCFPLTAGTHRTGQRISRKKRSPRCQLGPTGSASLLRTKNEYSPG